MAQDLHHDALVDALGQKQRGGCVAGVMQPVTADPGRLEQRFPFTAVGAGIDRPAGGLSPDEPAVMPEGPGGLPFGSLGDLVIAQRSNQLRRPGR
jgi:hypothetical protein